MSDYIRREDAVSGISDLLIFELKMKRCPTWNEVYNAIGELPSADVVHVVHGKWKKIGAWGRVYRCNQCGNFLDFDGVNAGRGAANFCPNCMAKMDGKKEG